MNRYDNKTAIDLIESRFPEISEDLRYEGWSDLLHLQVAVFSKFAQSVIDSGDREVWREISQTFLDLWQGCTPEVENALNVSFLEHLNFTDKKRQRSWAYEAMHPAMREAWDKMEEYNRKIHGTPGTAGE